MNIRHLISKFITSVCENNFAQANKELTQVVEKKITERVKETAKKEKNKKENPFAKKGEKKSPVGKKPVKKDEKKGNKKPVSAKQAAFFKKIGVDKK
jgi:hypothetical protein